MRYLIVYVTRSGNTEKVANIIQESIGGDIELITEPVNRKGIIGWMRSGGQNSKREPAKINPTQYDPSEYDLVILASPIWAGAVSSPMRGYMIQNAPKLLNTAVFLTNDSGNVQEAFSEIHEILPSNPLVEGSLQRSKMSKDLVPTVEQFIEEVSSASIQCREQT